MISADAILTGTDWAALAHAHGDAGDLPVQLAGLLSGDPGVAGRALGTLGCSVLHEGSLHSSTAPAALFVAAVLGDPRTGLSIGRRPLRAALLQWLGAVAECSSWGEDAGDDDGEGDEDPAAVAACREIRGDLYRTASLYLDDPDPAVRTAATGAAGHLLAAPELAGFRPAAAERLLRDTAGREPVERANAALTLARWDIAPRELLADAARPVRVYAALAPVLDSDPHALALVRDGLRDPAAADRWFPPYAVLLAGWPRFALVRALLRRTTGFAEVLDEALAIARMTSQYTVGADWGPLLQRAFPTPYSRDLLPRQRAFLAALAGNDACWGSSGGPVTWFTRAGLPHRRDDIRTLLRG